MCAFHSKISDFARSKSYSRSSRRRPRAYAPTSNTASHGNHDKINSWVSFSFLYGYGASLGGPSGRRSSTIMCCNENCHEPLNCWFSHDVTKFQTLELLTFLRFYFHDVLEQLKTNIHTNFHSEWVLGLVIDYPWISKLLRDVTFTWRARELLCWFKRWLVSGNSAISTVLVLE